MILRSPTSAPLGIMRVMLVSELLARFPPLMAGWHVTRRQLVRQKKQKGLVTCMWQDSCTSTRPACLLPLPPSALPVRCRRMPESHCFEHSCCSWYSLCADNGSKLGSQSRLASWWLPCPNSGNVLGGGLGPRSASSSAARASLAAVLAAFSVAAASFFSRFCSQQPHTH